MRNATGYPPAAWLHARPDGGIHQPGGGESRIQGIGLEPAGGDTYGPTYGSRELKAIIGEQAYREWQAFRRFQNLGGMNGVQSYSLATNIAAAAA